MGSAMPITEHPDAHRPDPGDAAALAQRKVVGTLEVVPVRGAQFRAHAGGAGGRGIAVRRRVPVAHFFISKN